MQPTAYGPALHMSVVWSARYATLAAIGILAAGVTTTAYGGGTGRSEATEAIPAVFRWQASQQLPYRIRQQTVVRETLIDPRSRQPQVTEVHTTLELVRQWHVRSVDQDGTATLQMTILRMRQQLQRGREEPVVRDSQKPDDAKEMTNYLNKPIVTVRVDRHGQIREVVEAATSSARRLEAELPFRLVLPATGIRPDQRWERTFRVVIDPPHGVGDAFPCIQQYRCTSIDHDKAVIAITTRCTQWPTSVAERLALIPYLWEGTVEFDLRSGEYLGSRLQVKETLADYAGPGSRYEYHSAFHEERLK